MQESNLFGHRQQISSSKSRYSRQYNYAVRLHKHIVFFNIIAIRLSMVYIHKVFPFLSSFPVRYSSYSPSLVVILKVQMLLLYLVPVVSR